MKRTYLVICYCLFVLPALNAQKSKKDKKENEKVVMISLDTIAAQCKDLPLEQKPRLTVARFDVSSPRQPSGDFGDNLATMLTNFLQETQCFRVLEQINNMKDLTNEINQGNSEYADKTTSIEKGKMLTANVVVTGEVVQFEMAGKSSNIMGVGNYKHTASIGVIIKLSDPKTREVLISRKFNADKETSSGTSVSISYVKFSNKTDQNPALQWAVDEVIKKAAIFICEQRSRIPMSAPAGENTSNTIKTVSGNSTIIINNIEYADLASVASSIEKIKGVKSVNSDNFDNNKATIYIQHTLKFKELLDKILLTNKGVKLAVQSMNKDGAILTVK